MPSREFIDSKGVHWVAWTTIPETPVGVGEDFSTGWLSFQSDADLRRLVPIPPRWLEATPERLELMCRAAASVARHTSPLSIDPAASAEAPEAGGSA